MTLSVTWWGHATTTVELGGTRVLTDPVLTRQLAHLRRLAGPVPHTDARRCDAVLISHLHPDHLHLPSLRTLPAGTRVVLPRGGGRLVRARCPQLAGAIDEVAAGDVLTVGALRVRAVPAHHDGRRLPGSRHRGPALGFVLSDGQRSIWFAGDTGLFDAMDGIGPVDTAIVPIGGWGPTLGPEHMDPEQAAQAVRRVAARDAVPVHYGTFWPVGLRRVHPSSHRRMFTDPARRFVAALAAADPAARAHVLLAGGSVDLP